MKEKLTKTTEKKFNSVQFHLFALKIAQISFEWTQKVIDKMLTIFEDSEKSKEIASKSALEGTVK
jgi:hypothetical protein